MSSKDAEKLDTEPRFQSCPVGLSREGGCSCATRCVAADAGDAYEEREAIIDYLENTVAGDSELESYARHFARCIKEGRHRQ